MTKPEKFRSSFEREGYAVAEILRRRYKLTMTLDGIVANHDNGDEVGGVTAMSVLQQIAPEEEWR